MQQSRALRQIVGRLLEWANIYRVKSMPSSRVKSKPESNLRFLLFRCLKSCRKPESEMTGIGFGSLLFHDSGMNDGNAKTHMKIPGGRSGMNSDSFFFEWHCTSEYLLPMREIRFSWQFAPSHARPECL